MWLTAALSVYVAERPSDLWFNVDPGGRMSDEILVIDDDDRYSRLRLIGWWDQEKLAQARILVVVRRAG